MSPADTLDETAAAQILHDALQRNQALDLIRELDGRSDTCRTRFVAAPDGRLLVVVPSRHGHLVPVRPGEELEIYFRLGELRYQFLSAVIDRAEIQVDGLAMPVLVLQRPRHIRRRQRRQFFRVSTHVGYRLLTQLWRAPPSGQGRPTALGRFEVLDLSAGGLRLLCPKPESCPLSDETLLVIALPLQEAQEPLKLNGIVKHVSHIPDGPVHVGVAFLNLDDSPAGKLIRNRLLRFVSEREREELRRMNAP